MQSRVSLWWGVRTESDSDPVMSSNSVLCYPWRSTVFKCPHVYSKVDNFRAFCLSESSQELDMLL